MIYLKKIEIALKLKILLYYKSGTIMGNCCGG